ncbi:DUF2690 domain-containing protein [Streptomyces sp. NBC_00250]|uniref:DUF2690 domain-containing protein n=1 Tax=Streptomyces sp. NBC_00250 TaxID=2903641 RepID=UPI002E2D4330|nr:DUF2690 domain-containing protein [Streptomyces sp. NBC_00250]
MGVDGGAPAADAKQRLARLLRGWWEQHPGKVTQEALARRITERGVRTSQEMLSRYLHRTRPTLARTDVIRAMHEVLGRAEEELASALALHDEASEAPGSAPAAMSPPPSPPAPAAADPAAAAQAQAPAIAAGVVPASEGAVVPEVPGEAEDEVVPAVPDDRGSVSAPSPEPVVASTAVLAPAASSTSGSRVARTLWIVLASCVVVGMSVVGAVVLDSDRDRSKEAQPPAGPPASSLSSSFPFSAAPTSTAECQGASCFGVDPKYAVCREDAVTYYTGSGHGIRVELRFSAMCQAAWAKMSGTSQGDVVRVTNNAGRSRHYTQQWGHDAHSTMVEALNPDDAKACARTPRGEVCATVPVSR